MRLFVCRVGPLLCVCVLNATCSSCGWVGWSLQLSAVNAVEVEIRPNVSSTEELKQTTTKDNQSQHRIRSIHVVDIACLLLCFLVLLCVFTSFVLRIWSLRTRFALWSFPLDFTQSRLPADCAIQLFNSATSHNKRVRDTDREERRRGTPMTLDTFGLTCTHSCYVHSSQLPSPPRIIPFTSDNTNGIHQLSTTVEHI